MSARRRVQHVSLITPSAEFPEPAERIAVESRFDGEGRIAFQNLLDRRLELSRTS